MSVSTPQNHGLLKDFLHQKSALFSKVAHMDSFDFIYEHSKVLDTYFAASYEKCFAGSKKEVLQYPFSLIALGGYGRAEQCVSSDVDLLFLFEKNVPDFAEKLIEEIVYPLWDGGLSVSHTTLSLKESIALAEEDFPTLTSLLDARLIAGDQDIYQQLFPLLHSSILKKRADNIIHWLVESNQSRHKRFGDSAYLLEPNLKEGRGGLRDYHTILWIARIQSGVKALKDLKQLNYFSSYEYETFISALSFIFKVRNLLHIEIKRKCDQLYLEHQTRLAELMEVHSNNGHLPVEQLLGELHSHMECIKQHHLLFLYEMEYLKKTKGKRVSKVDMDVHGLSMDRGMLKFTSAAAVKRSPQLILLIFYESAVKKTPLHPEAVRIIRENPELIDDHFRCSGEYAKVFEKILLKPAPNFNVLNQMLHTGFLVRYIPEFKETVNRIQFDQYHLFPVARHLLSTVRILKGFGLKQNGDDLFLGELYRKIRQKKVLVWAALLHDIGKAQPESGHAKRGALIVEDILSPKGLSPNDINTVVFLVRYHLLLIETATRRDITDEETCVRIAQRVKDKERLTMLYLLTVADSKATGPKAFNPWTASLLKSLFINVMTLFEGKELTSRKAVQTVETRKSWLYEENQRQMLFSDKAFQKMLDILSPRYLLYVHEADIFSHLKLYDRLKENPFVWEIQKHPESSIRTLSICAADRPGLMSKIAGALTINNMNILNVRVYTLLNNVALDIFDVELPEDPYFEDERWSRAENDLTLAISEELNLTEALSKKQLTHRSIKGRTTDKAQTVTIDNDSSSFYTIIEVIAWNYPGLLFKITHTFFERGLDIWVAKVATKVDQIVDVFYVRDISGQKISDPESVQSIQKAIQNILQ